MGVMDRLTLKWERSKTNERKKTDRWEVDGKEGVEEDIEDLESKRSVRCRN